MNKFLAEIMEQPQAIENITNFYANSEGKELLEKIKKTVSEKNIQQIIFTGMGSSYFLSHAASSLFNHLNIHSSYINTSELLHYNLSLFEKQTMLVCSSQSGESFEVKEILDHLPKTVFCVGIVNDEDSALAHRADVALLCKGGKEEMTSTKTYVVTSLAACILGWYLAGEWDDEKIGMLNRLKENFKTLLNHYNGWLSDALAFLGDISTLQIIARGPAFSTASQSALMFKEATHIAATGILGGEFRHGPMEMVTEGFQSILFASEGKTLIQSIKMAEDIAEFGGKVWLITNVKSNLDNKNILPMYINEKDEFLFSLQSIVPVQLFIDAYAKTHGFEAGNFSRGAKVTVIE
ncbi:SIS domain-containing protein [Petrimonas sp.]|uniref:SIS domain-containing protein n=1 Tax=Petrimonas sp. TaxID=2023866 RepID=UPI003F514A5B